MKPQEFVIRVDDSLVLVIPNSKFFFPSLNKNLFSMLNIPYVLYDRSGYTGIINPFLYDLLFLFLSFLFLYNVLILYSLFSILSLFLILILS